MQALTLIVVSGASLGVGFLLGIASLRRSEKKAGNPGPPGSGLEVGPELEAASEIDPEFADLQAELGVDLSVPTESTSLLESEVHELRARLADLAPLGEQLGRAEKEVLERRAEVEQLQSDLEALEKRRATVAARERRLRERWRAVPEDARTAAEHIASAREQVDTTRREKRGWERDRKRLEKQIAKLEKSATKASARAARSEALLGKSRARSSVRLERVRDLEATLVALRLALTDAQSRRAETTVPAPFPASRPTLGPTLATLMQVQPGSAKAKQLMAPRQAEATAERPL